MSKYTPSEVADSRARISNFVLSLFDMVVKECQTTMLIHDMGISNLMVHAQQFEVEKLKEKSIEDKGLRLVTIASLTKGPMDNVV